MKSNIEDIDVIFVHSTERAVLVRKDEADKEGSWFPLSQVEVDGLKERGRVVTLTAPDWLLIEKGFI